MAKSLYLSILIALLAIVCQMPDVQSASIVNISNGGLDMQLIDGILTCGNLTCPKDTDKCSIQQTNRLNATAVVTSVACLDAKNTVLVGRNSSEPIDSGARVNNYSELSVNGSTLSCVGCEGSTPTEIKANMEKNMAENQAKLDAEMAALERRMQAMSDKLSHMFDGLF